MIPKKPAPDLIRVDAGFWKEAGLKPALQPESNKDKERDGDSKKNHPALAPGFANA
jgi:hypothetical protein